MGNTKFNPNTSLTEKVIFRSPYVEITFNETEKWLYVQWHGERTTQTLMDGAEQLLMAVKATKSKKIINDSTDFSNPWPNVTDYFAEQFAPRLQEAGVQYLAWIYDDKNVTKTFADAILKKEKSDILVMVFDNVKTAEIWLHSIR